MRASFKSPLASVTADRPTGHFKGLPQSCVPSCPVSTPTDIPYLQGLTVFSLPVRPRCQEPKTRLHGCFRGDLSFLLGCKCSRCRHSVARPCMSWHAFSAAAAAVFVIVAIVASSATDHAVRTSDVRPPPPLGCFGPPPRALTDRQGA